MLSMNPWIPVQTESCTSLEDLISYALQLGLIQACRIERKGYHFKLHNGLVHWTTDSEATDFLTALLQQTAQVEPSVGTRSMRGA